MSEPIPIFEATETFYVPHFQVKVGGRGLPDDVVGDVTQVSYRDSTRGIDSFELTVNNWDARELAFKYEPPVKGEYQGIFDPGQRLELSMGYVRNLRFMLKGEITALEPDYPAAGGPILRVRGLNVLHSLRKKQHTDSWVNKRDSDIAESMSKQPADGEKPGLEVEVRVDAMAKALEPVEPFVFMKGQYPIMFLIERARLRGYAVWLDEENGEEVLRFGPSHGLHDVTYTLEWGKSLVDFRPTLSTPRQVNKVTVRGWDRRTKEPIVESATWGDVAINDDQDAVKDAIQDREEIVTDEPVHTREQARARARDLLSEQLKEMVKASGSTVGLPDLRAGRRLRITGFGDRFSGEYFVTETTHTISGSGYRTTFSARRERGE